MNYPSEILPGTLVDRRYLVKKNLGQGGFGRTYLVEDQRRFNDLFVLKEFAPKTTDEYIVTKSQELFKREAETLNKLKHPQIPKFFGWFAENKRLFLVQQYIDGKTYTNILEERQQQGETFSEAEVISWLKNLLSVLQYIHDNNIIHRDISPDNIMLCHKTHQPMLIDFGVVNQLKATQISGESNYNQGTIVGKQLYAPIEQISAGVCYPNSDLYALAVTALVLLTGKHPRDFFDGYTRTWKWREHVKIGQTLGQVLDKMLSEIPQNRYQSAADVLDELSVKPPENDRPAPKSPKYLIPSVAGLTIVSFGLLFWQTPNISSLCNILNNCSRHIELRAKYQQVLENIEPTLAVTDNSETLKKLEWEELEGLRDEINRAIADLQTIPDDAKIQPQVQQSLEDFQAQLNRLNEEMKIKEPIW